MFNTIKSMFGMATKKKATKRKSTTTKKRKKTTKKTPLGMVKKATVGKKITALRKSLGV